MRYKLDILIYYSAYEDKIFELMWDSAASKCKPGKILARCTDYANYPGNDFNWVALSLRDHKRFLRDKNFVLLERITEKVWRAELSKRYFEGNPEMKFHQSAMEKMENEKNKTKN